MTVLGQDMKNKGSKEQNIDICVSVREKKLTEFTAGGEVRLNQSSPSPVSSAFTANATLRNALGLCDDFSVGLSTCPSGMFFIQKELTEAAATCTDSEEMITSLQNIKMGKGATLLKPVSLFRHFYFITLFFSPHTDFNIFEIKSTHHPLAYEVHF